MLGIQDIATLAAVVTAIAALIAIGVSLWTFYVPRLEHKRTQEMLKRELGAGLFDEYTLDQATRYYIKPNCTEVDPSTESELSFAASPATPLFKFIDSFLRPGTSESHLLLLADSGMGKTAALINYYVTNRRVPDPFRHKIYVVPLGIGDADERIRKILDPQGSILFLDALDEDIKAIGNYHERITEIMTLCSNFRRVIITCRTHFFQTDDDIPKDTGIPRIGPRPAGQSSRYRFKTIYLMPLSDQQVDKYLKKRYPLGARRRRKEAKRLVEKIPLLSIRPMLLAYVPDLIRRGVNRDIQYSYQLYEEMVNAWLERESSWIEPANLRKFSEQLAVDLFVNREKRGAERAHPSELLKLAHAWNFDLDTDELTTRSLLNRDAEGRYKFAHRSIMEYLVTQSDSLAWYDTVSAKPSDQMIVFVNEIIENRDWKHLRFTFGVDLGGIDLRGADFSNARLSTVNLAGAYYDEKTKWPPDFSFATSGAFGPGAMFGRADLREVNLSHANLCQSSFEQADLRGADLNHANLRESNFKQADLRGADLSHTNLVEANLSAVKFEGANVDGADLTAANLAYASMIEVSLQGAHLWHTNMVQAKMEHVDLRGVDLSRTINLNTATLSAAIYNIYTKWPIEFDYRSCGAFGPRAILRHAQLYKVDLTDLDLSHANLMYAELTYATLSGTNLTGAFLHEANLVDANLRDAVLRGANFRGARLSGADFTGAILEGAVFQDATCDQSTRWPAGFDYESAGIVRW